MGLDMYLYKTKKLNEEASLNEILKINNFFSRKEKGQKCSLDVDMNLAKVYEPEYKERFYPWDTDKEYPRKSVTQMICDWRKANQIHYWFVENVQEGEDDCGEYEVTKENLEELYQICKAVLYCSKLEKAKVRNGEKFENGNLVPIIQEGEVIKDPTIAKKLLPSKGGFFFGSTDYDEFYYHDVKYTMEKLEKILKETDFENEIVFYSSSW